MSKDVYEDSSGRIWRRREIVIWTDGEEVIIPDQEFLQIDDDHECDIMGCVQQHVVARFPFPDGCKNNFSKKESVDEH